jgi:hypothetical protein
VDAALRQPIADATHLRLAEEGAAAAWLLVGRFADLEIEETVDAAEEFADDEDAAAEHIIDHIRRDFGEGEGDSF